MASILGQVGFRQAAAYVATGLWPIVDLRSFERVTGPKHDDWLVRTVGGLAVALGAGLAWRSHDPASARPFGVAGAAAFLAADLVVIATPMWNFNAPPMLKAFIDTILVAGKTFKYTATGPVGLVSGKKAVLCIASGGVYEGAMAAYDTLTPMLKTQLGFIGITDVAELRAPGQGAGGEKAKASTLAAVAKAKEAAGKF